MKQSRQRDNFALSMLISLFFFWGFITCLNDILIPHLKSGFDLTYLEATLIQFCFFTAYLIVSLPAGRLIQSIGFKKGIITGLLTTSVGCLLFIPAANYALYPLFLLALFVLASGITVLQVSANPLVNAMGCAKSAAARLNLSQGFNALGTAVAPVLGGAIILAGSAAAATEIGSVKLPYLVLSGMLIGVAILFTKIQMPKVAVEKVEPVSTTALLKTNPLLLMGGVSLFAYVGAEVAIGSLLINYLGLDNIKQMTEQDAAGYVSFYWAGAMVGRFLGAALMKVVHPAILLAVNATLVIFLLCIVVLSAGNLAFGAVLLIGLFNSIMFPTIFSLALKEVKVHVAQASGVLCLTIFGGAVIPLFQGFAADTIGLQMSFIIPMISYVLIAVFALTVYERHKGEVL